MIDQKSLAANDVGSDAESTLTVVEALVKENLSIDSHQNAPIVLGLLSAQPHKPQGKSTILEAVNFCMAATLGTIGAHQKRLQLEDDLDPEERSAAIKEDAAAAFLFCLPAITSKLQAQAFIACVAAGQQHGLIKGEQARALLYTAQLALAAHGRPGARRPHETRGGAA